MENDNWGRKVTQCRMCESKNLFEFLDLGFAPPSDGILSPQEMKEGEVFFPLKVVQCEDCGLTQLSYSVNPEILYGSKYKYESSITETGKKHFFSMADSISKRFGLGKGDLAVDIGSNVGVLLEGFKKNGLDVLGVDPAPLIAKKANERGIETLAELISPELAYKIIQLKKKAKVVTATNVFAHIDDKESLMKSIGILMDSKGIFVIEAPYVVDLIENLEYDTIYLEHLEYTSIRPLVKFFSKYGLEIFDVEKYNIHGKSLRIFVCRAGTREISDNVKKFMDIEIEKGIYRKDVLRKFSKDVENNKTSLLKLLNELKDSGKKVVGISAPAKGNTLLNYCKIDSTYVQYLAEKSSMKTGHFTPGMHIPIINEERLIIDKPDYGIIFAWNFAPEIMKNNAQFLKNGGKFIIPVPYPRIVSSIDSQLVGQKIIVTGSDGFLGKHLVEQLLKIGVPSNDIFIPKSKDYNLIKEQDVERLFKDFPADIIFHLAAITGVMGVYEKRPGSIFYDNLLMGMNIIRKSAENKIKKLILIGSAVMYPYKSSLPLREEHIFDGAPNPVGESYAFYKRTLLNLSSLYRKEFGLKSIFIIPANLYGPADYFEGDRSHVVPALISKFVKAKESGSAEVEVWGSGNAFRELLYVEDAAKLIINLAESYDSREPINLGSGYSISIRDLAEKISALSEFHGNIKWNLTKPEGQLKMDLDISRLKLAVGQFNYTSIDEGLKKTISWYLNNRNTSK